MGISEAGGISRSPPTGLSLFLQPTIGYGAIGAQRCTTTIRAGEIMKKFLLLISLVSFSALALDHNLMKITNDEDGDIVIFVLETNEHNTEIVGMRKDIYDSRMKFIDTVAWSANEVLQGGAVIATSGNYKVVKLKVSSPFSLQNGGTINLDYLYSGITGSRKDFKISLKKSNGKWINSKGKTVIKKLHFVSNKKMIVGTIGIKEITIN